MLNMYKSQLVQAMVQVLRHKWSLGGFWAPNVIKLAILMEKLDGQLAWVNWASLDVLLNIKKE